MSLCLLLFEITSYRSQCESVLVRAAPPSQDFLGIVSDRSLLEWFTIQAEKTPSFANFLSTPLSFLALPSLYLYSAVVAAKVNDTVLDAMRLMSNYGVSSIAVIQEDGGGLRGAVSVTDIGNVGVSALEPRIVDECRFRLSFPLKAIRYCPLPFISSLPPSR